MIPVAAVFGFLPSSWPTHWVSERMPNDQAALLLGRASPTGMIGVPDVVVVPGAAAALEAVPGWLQAVADRTAAINTVNDTQNS